MLNSDKTLALSGYAVDSIAQLGPALFDESLKAEGGMLQEMHHLATSYKACIELLQNATSVPSPYTYATASASLVEPTAGQPPLEAFRRTLFLDRKYISWKTKPQQFLQLFTSWEEQLAFFEDRNAAQAMLVSAKPAFYERLEDIESVTEELRACCGGRRFFITRNGYIGLYPPYAEQGDLVYAVPGLHVPVMLRPGLAERPSRQSCSGRKTLQYVGECYVHGLMDGEGLSTGAVQEDVEIE